MNQWAFEPWTADWAWGLPLVVINAIVHVLGLGVIQLGVEQLVAWFGNRRARLVAFVGVLGVTILLATLLHAAEATIWAAAYLFLGALDSARSAMLYSLSAITSFGHANLFLADQWQMMGALESLNGMLLFGLTTAFLYSTILKVRSGLNVDMEQIAQRFRADSL